MHTEDSLRRQTTVLHLPAKCNIHQNILFVTWPDHVPVLMVSQAQHHVTSNIFDDIDISILSHGTGISVPDLWVSGNNAGRMRDAGKAQGRSPPWLQSVSWNEMDDGNSHIHNIINGTCWGCQISTFQLAVWQLAVTRVPFFLKASHGGRERRTTRIRMMETMQPLLVAQVGWPR